jgi:glycosyltransferase involved in cell wall biosynthesis
MKILYLSYWGINDGLTQSAILPHIALLQDFESVTEIILVTIERNETNLLLLNTYTKVVHIPLYSSNIAINVLNKINDYLIFPGKLKKIIEERSISVALSHGSPGGALLHKSCFPKIPYYVFFEPHSQYMLESGVWSKYDMRYIFMKKWENTVIQHASGLFCVTQNYLKTLTERGVQNERLKFVPNFVDEKVFAFQPTKRMELRQHYAIPTGHYIGIYVGKFGGIYLDDEAFSIFERSYLYFQQQLFLIILTPDDSTRIYQELIARGIPKECLLIKKVKHEEVSHFLSAADFAYSLQQPKFSNRYLSPLKNGEYWMSGLPILMMEGVGDEMHYILEEQGGDLLKADLSNVEQGLSNIKHMIDNHSTDAVKVKMAAIALAYRSKIFTIKAFSELIRSYHPL